MAFTSVEKSFRSTPAVQRTGLRDPVHRRRHGGIAIQPVVPATHQQIDDATYDNATSAYGFLTVKATAKRLNIAFWPAVANAKKPFDSVAVELKTRKIV